MSLSEFSSAISAATEAHFGGGESYFSERRSLAANPDGRSANPHKEQKHEHEPEENDEQEKVQLTIVEYKADAEFEPTYDLSHGPEQHPHVGLLLDVKL